MSKKFGDTEHAVKLIREMSENGLRICQIMSNLFDVMAKDGCDPFYVEDSKLVEYLSKYSEEK